MESTNAKLLVTSGKLSGRGVAIRGNVIIGRAPSAKIRLPDVKLSREHAKIYQQGADWYVVDLNSRNGTLVNGSKVTKRLLTHGDEITVGETVLLFENRPPAQKTPARVQVPREKKTAFREVIDLSGSATRPKPSAPAGAMSADQIKVKDGALQFSRHAKGKRRKNVLFDDLGQRSALFQLGIALVVILFSAALLFVGLYLGGVVGTK